MHGSIKHGIGGDVNGTSVRLGGGRSTALSRPDRLLLDLAVDWADRHIMQAYFGVSGAQSARSGLAAYSAGSGIRRYGLRAAWTHASRRTGFPPWAPRSTGSARKRPTAPSCSNAT